MPKWLMIIITAVLAGGLGVVCGWLGPGRGGSADDGAGRQADIDAAVQQVRDETTAAIREGNENMQKTIEQLNQTNQSVKQLNDRVEQLKLENNALAEELSGFRSELAARSVKPQTEIDPNNVRAIEASPTKTEQVKAKTEETKVLTDEIIVYVTRTGKKYHRADCPSLSKSKIPIKLSEARARGYEPCKMCKPPGE